MMIRLFAFVTLIVLCTSCERPEKDMDEIKEEIRQAEMAFNDLAAEKGVAEAFLTFAADSAVIMRGGKLLKGKQEIREYFDEQTLQKVRLSWEPEFIDVAEAGDIAYTYGPYTFSAIDTTGKEINSTGYFHTVWKRQQDGSWKFVYD